MSMGEQQTVAATSISIHSWNRIYTHTHTYTLAHTRGKKLMHANRRLSFYGLSYFTLTGLIIEEQEKRERKMEEMKESRSME